LEGLIINISALDKLGMPQSFLIDSKCIPLLSGKSQYMYSVFSFRGVRLTLMKSPCERLIVQLLTSVWLRLPHRSPIEWIDRDTLIHALASRLIKVHAAASHL
jgi:hypothetical protein